MHLTYGAGHTDVIVDIANKKVVRYKSLAHDIHEQHGGKQYYCSRSGLSGAGNIPGSAFLLKANTLCRVHGVTLNDESKKRVYVQDHYCSTHIDKDTVFVVEEHENSEKIEIWKLHEFLLCDFLLKKIQFSKKDWGAVDFLRADGGIFSKEVIVHYLDNSKLGFPFLLFTRNYREYCLDGEKATWETPVHAQFAVGKVGRYYLQFDKFGIPIARCDEDPILSGRPLAGWTLLKKWEHGAYYARIRLNADEKILVVGLANAEYVGKVDYEIEIDRFELADIAKIDLVMREGMEKKRVTLYAEKRHSERREKILSEIEGGMHDDVYLTFGEAIAAGYCEPGINRFVDEYNLDVDKGYASKDDFRITIAALRHSEKYEMLKTRQEFQTLVTLKVMKQ